MARFGSFEVVRELSSAQGAVVYLVRGEGGEFVVKLFSGAASATGDTEVWRRGDFSESGNEAAYANAAEFSAAVKRQEQAAGDGTGHVAPILETGEDERGTWYRTAYYKNTLKRIIGLHLKPELFHSIILSITRGTLAFKGASGVAHGNLKPTNVFVVTEERGRKSKAVITDPLPVRGRSDARYEVEDLHALGEIIFQIVRRKEISARENWPLPPGPEWTAWFGKKAEQWRELCNRLLDPQLSPGSYTLEQLEEELKALEPKTAISRPVLIAAAAVVVAAGVAAGIYFATRPKTEAVAALDIVTEPAGARVFVEDLELQDVITPFQGDHKQELPSGRVKIMLQHTNTDYYPSLTTNVTLQAGKPLRLSVRLKRYTGTVALKSDLPNVECFHEGRSIGVATPTGSTSQQIEVGLQELSARHKNSLLAPATVRVMVDKKIVREADFQFPRGGLIVNSEPVGARVLINGVDVGATPYENLYLNPGEMEVTLTNRTHNADKFTVKIASGQTIRHPLRSLSQGQGTVAFRISPPGVNVIWEGQSKVVPTSGSLEWQLPAGDRRITLHHEALGSNSFQVEVKRDATTRVETNLPHAWLYVQSLPSDAEVRRNGKLVGKTGTPLLVAVGRASYEVKKGNLSGTFDFSAENGATRTNEVELTEGFGTIELVSNLAGAIIRRSDGSSNTVPASGSITLTNQRAVRHEFAAHYPGLDPVKKDVTVVKDGSVRLEMDFAFGKARITMPPNVKVETTNHFETAANGVFFPILKPGPFDLVWESDFYVRNATNLTIVDRQTTEIDITKLLEPRRGAVTLTTSEGAPPAAVLIDGVPSGRELPFTTNLPVRIQPYRFTVPHRRGPISAEVLVTRDTVTNVLFAMPSEPKPYTNNIYGIKMEFAWMPDVPVGTSNGCYVGRYEVTFQQVTNVLGTNTHANKYKGRPAYGEAWPGRAPADSVPAKLAENFCLRLTTLDSNAPPGYRYELPSLEQYKSYCHYSATNVSVYLGWKEINQASPAPKPIGARGPDDNGLYDVSGNMHELVRYQGGLTPVGTAYCTPIITVADLELSMGSGCEKETGFRVILVPGPQRVATATLPAP